MVMSVSIDLREEMPVRRKGAGDLVANKPGFSPHAVCTQISRPPHAKVFFSQLNHNKLPGFTCKKPKKNARSHFFL